MNGWTHRNLKKCVSIHLYKHTGLNKCCGAVMKPGNRFMLLRIKINSPACFAPLAHVSLGFGGCSGACRSIIGTSKNSYILQCNQSERDHQNTPYCLLRYSAPLNIEWYRWRLSPAGKAAPWAHRGCVPACGTPRGAAGELGHSPAAGTPTEQR